MIAGRGLVLTLRENREVGDERELGRARGLDQRRVERRQRQLVWFLSVPSEKLGGAGVDGPPAGHDG